MFLFDDVLSELDENRKRVVLTGITRGQVIITACEREIFTGIDGNIITVNGGVYS